MRAGVRLLGAALLLCACDVAPEASPTPEEAAPPRARVVVGVHVIEAEVADTPARRRQGLSGRPRLAPHTGMLFRYETPDRYGIWMPDMHFDIDIVWMHAGRIVHIEHDVPHVVEGALPTYLPDEPADSILEVVAGTAARLGWQVGDRVRIEAAPR